MVGTFALWIGHPRPCMPAIEYLLKGAHGAAPVTIPAKYRVHDFLFNTTLLHLDCMVATGAVSGFLVWV